MVVLGCGWLWVDFEVGADGCRWFSVFVDDFG